MSVGVTGVYPALCICESCRSLIAICHISPASYRQANTIPHISGFRSTGLSAPCDLS
jgi:hypothetical protein